MDWAKDLQVAHHIVKGSLKGIQFLWVVSPTKSPKSMGLKGIHSPKAFHQQVGLSFCLWCRKEGQNEGTVVNHCRQVITTWASSALCVATHICVSRHQQVSMTTMTKRRNPTLMTMVRITSHLASSSTASSSSVLPHCSCQDGLPLHMTIQSRCHPWWEYNSHLCLERLICIPSSHQPAEHLVLSFLE